jgi:ABC-2 type transport system ATP-binding protein
MTLMKIKPQLEVPVIKVDNITQTFGKATEALKNINFTLDEPTILSIVGTNGAGKSTLIKIMLGLISPTNGKVKVLGYDPYLKQTDFLKKVGFISGQKRILSNDLSARRSITGNALFYDLSLTEIQERLENLSILFKVNHKLDQLVRTLSLGEIIKLEIINSIIHKPKIVFLDEPSIGLDFDSHETIINLLKQLHQIEQVTIVLTSHYMRDIKALSKQILVLENGQQLYSGDFNNLPKNTNMLNSYLDSLNKEIVKYS